MFKEKFKKLVNRANSIINNKDGVMEDTIINSPFAVINKDITDKIFRLIQKGKQGEVISLLDRTMRGVSAQHPLYPHYRYEIAYDMKSGITFSHVPNSPEALEKYPMTGTMSLVIPEEMRNKYQNLNEMIKDAYWNQTSIEFDALSFKAMIGEDYLLHNFDSSSGDKATITITPQKFPSPKLMKLFIVGKDFSLDHLLIGVARIEHGNVLVLNNYTQENARLLFEIKLDFASKGATFNLKAAEGYQNDVRTQHDLTRFLYEADSHQIGLEESETGNEVLSSTSSECHVDFVDRQTLTARVLFLSNLLKLQRRFSVKFTLPNENLTNDELEILEMLLRIYENKPIEMIYSNFTGIAHGKQQVKILIDACETHPDGLSINLVSTGGSIDFLDAHIEIDKVKLDIVDGAVVKDYSKLKKRFELMEEGDSIVVTYIPKDPNKNDILAYYTINN